MENIDNLELPIAHCREKFAQAFLVDVAGVLLVEAAERVFDYIFGVGALEPLAEEGQEHGEVYRTWGFVHHSFEILVGRIFPCKQNPKFNKLLSSLVIMFSMFL